MEKIDDYIISAKTKQVFAHVVVTADEAPPNSYSGQILEQQFPADLLELLKEFDELVNGMSFTLVDEVDDKILAYELRLRDSGMPVYDLVIEGDNVSFLSKYPRKGGQ